MATTPNYSFSVYSSTDTDVRFLDFRVATAGSQSTSNFYVIDTVLKQHSDAIDSINATPSAFVVKGTYSAGSLYTASVANYPGYKNEQLIVLSLNQKNTGAVQININGTTNKDVMKYGSDGVLKAVDAGDFVANSPVLCLYDGTRFVVIGITSASSITVTGEAGDILQIADDGTIESSGKKAAQPNGIATLDENGNVVQVANMANSAAAVYSGEPVTIEYADENRIGSVTAYGNNSQTSGTTTAPISMSGVDSVQVSGNNLFINNVTEGTTNNGITFTLNPDRSITVNGTNTSSTSSAVMYTSGIVSVNMDITPGTYIVSGSNGTALVEVKIIKASGEIKYYSGTTTGLVFTTEDGDILERTYILVRAGQTADNVTVYPMLNVGSTALPYEPYNGSITRLPIPRELHRISDVADKCITSVKSIYDNKVTLNGNASENWQLANGVFYYEYAFINNALKAGACDRYKFIIGNNGTTDVITDKTFSFYTGAPQRVMVRDNSYTTVEEFKSYLASNPLTIYYQSTAYDGTNGLDVCLTEYQTGFVELDGTEASHIFEGMFYLDYSASWPTPANRVNGVCSHYPYGAYGKGKIGLTDNGAAVVYNPNGDYTGDEGGLANWKAYLAAQKEAGTPVQVAYQLAAPEVYATDPVDFDNAAGPLTVVTGGQVEVKMTDFVTDRTPAFLNKLDKTGDGSDVTVTFTEAATDTDIASGDKLSILFGKILKRFSTITSKFTTVDNSITQIESDISDITDGTTVVAQANKVTNALVIMSNSGTSLVNYDGSATANMTLSPSNVGAEPAFTKNTAFNKNFGSSAGTVCQGNDGRLSNARRSSNITMSLSGTNLSISYS